VKNNLGELFLLKKLL